MMESPPSPIKNLLLGVLLAAVVAWTMTRQRPAPPTPQPRASQAPSPTSSAPASPTPRRPQRGFWSQRFEAMGTHVSLQTRFSKRVEAYAIVKGIFAKVDSMMSEWKPGSALAAVNRAAGRHRVKVPGALFALIQHSKEIGAITEGAFDITWAALWNLWDFKQKPPKVPSKAEVAARRQWVDYRRIQLDPLQRTVKLPYRKMKLGLGGIAKGYALQQAASELRMAGLKNFLISAGGHVWVSGQKHGKRWRVGIRDPRGGPDDLVTTFSLSNTSISTSGDYERYFINKGIRYHHILDPRTGYPSKGVRSATVISPDAALADALSTAFMILPVSKSLTIARRHRVRALIIDGTGKLHRATSKR